MRRAARYRAGTVRREGHGKSGTGRRRQRKVRIAVRLRSRIAERDRLSTAADREAGRGVAAGVVGIAGPGSAGAGGSDVGVVGIGNGQ